VGLVAPEAQGAASPAHTCVAQGMYKAHPVLGSQGSLNGYAHTFEVRGRCIVGKGSARQVATYTATGNDVFPTDAPNGEPPRFRTVNVRAKTATATRTAAHVWDMGAGSKYFARIGTKTVGEGQFVVSPVGIEHAQCSGGYSCFDYPLVVTYEGKIP
jgi:hypothetical protein